MFRPDPFCLATLDQQNAQVDGLVAFNQVVYGVNDTNAQLAASGSNQRLSIDPVTGQVTTEELKVTPDDSSGKGLGYVKIGKLVNLGTVDNVAAAQPQPQDFWANATPEQIAAAVGATWDRTHQGGVSDWSAIQGGFAQYSSALNSGATLGIRVGQATGILIGPATGLMEAAAARGAAGVLTGQALGLLTE